MEGDTEEGDHAHLLPTVSSTSGYSQDVSDSKAPGREQLSLPEQFHDLQSCDHKQ